MLFLFTPFNYLHSQEYDLILTVTKDSIACHIDSITDNKIFFKMICNHKWLQTNYDKRLILDYQFKALRKKNIAFKRGTSFLINPNLKPINNIKRNTVFLTGGYFLYHYTATVNYERTFFMNDENLNSWTYKFGYGIIDSNGKIILGTLNSYLGKGLNKYEFNIGVAYIKEPHSFSENYLTFVLNIGYRWQFFGGKLHLRTGIGTPEGLYLSSGYFF